MVGNSSEKYHFRQCCTLVSYLCGRLCTKRGTNPVFCGTSFYIYTEMLHKYAVYMQRKSLARKEKDLFLHIYGVVVGCFGVVVGNKKASTTLYIVKVFIIVFSMFLVVSGCGLGLALFYLSRCSSVYVLGFFCSPPCKVARCVSVRFLILFCVLSPKYIISTFLPPLKRIVTDCCGLLRTFYRIFLFRYIKEENRLLKIFLKKHKKSVDTVRCLIYCRVTEHGALSVEREGNTMTNYKADFGLKACLDECKWEVEKLGVNPFEELGKSIIRAENDIFFNKRMVEAWKLYISENGLKW